MSSSDINSRDEASAAVHDEVPHMVYSDASAPTQVTNTAHNPAHAEDTRQYGYTVHADGHYFDLSSTRISSPKFKPGNIVTMATTAASAQVQADDSRELGYTVDADGHYWVLEGGRILSPKFKPGDIISVRLTQEQMDAIGYDEFLDVTEDQIDLGRYSKSSGWEAEKSAQRKLQELSHGLENQHLDDPTPAVAEGSETRVPIQLHLHDIVASLLHEHDELTPEEASVVAERILDSWHKDDEFPWREQPAYKSRASLQAIEHLVCSKSKTA